MKKYSFFELADYLEDPYQSNMDEIYTHAGVGIILSQKNNDDYLILIERVERKGDPWSGHLALPGGVTDPHDGHPLITGMREIYEETGLKLGHSDLVGKLTPHLPRTKTAIRGRPVLIHPFIFYLSNISKVCPDPREIKEIYYLPLKLLFNKLNFVEREFKFEQFSANLPAIDLASIGVQKPLWGVTYVILIDFLKRLLKTSKASDYLQRGTPEELLKAWKLGAYASSSL